METRHAGSSRWLLQRSMFLEQSEGEIQHSHLLGNFVNRLKDSFDVDPSKHLSSNNQLQFFVEWANKAPSGLRSKEGRAAGTGAYIYKAEISTKFTPNMSKSEVASDAKVIKNFSSGDSFEQTKIFGIKREK